MCYDQEVAKRQEFKPGQLSDGELQDEIKDKEQLLEETETRLFSLREEHVVRATRALWPRAHYVSFYPAWEEKGPDFWRAGEVLDEAGKTLAKASYEDDAVGDYFYKVENAFEHLPDLEDYYDIPEPGCELLYDLEARRVDTREELGLDDISV